MTACTDPKADRELAYQRGLNAMAEKRFDWARRYFAEDLELNPDRLASLKQLGLAWSAGMQESQHNLTQAIQAFERYLVHQPRDTNAQLQLTRILFAAGEWSAAQRWAGRLADSPEAALLKTEIYLDSHPAIAQAAIAHALQNNVDQAELQIMAARVAFQEGALQPALLHIQQAIRLGSVQPQTYYLLARLHRQLNAPTLAQDALELYQLLLQLTPAGRATRATAAERLSALHRLEDTLIPLPYALHKIKPQLLFETGQTAKALQVLEQLLSHPKIDTSTRLELAELAKKHNRLVRAQQLFSHVLEQQPNNRAARSGLARLAFQSGAFDTMQQLVDEGLRREPQLARYHYLHGLVALQTRRVTQAEQSFQTALRLTPWSVEWRLQLAEVYLSQGQFERLAELLKNAPEQDPRLEQFQRRHGL